MLVTLETVRPPAVILLVTLRLPAKELDAVGLEAMNLEAEEIPTTSNGIDKEA